MHVYMHFVFVTKRKGVYLKNIRMRKTKLRHVKGNIVLYAARHKMGQNLWKGRMKMSKRACLLFVIAWAALFFGCGRKEYMDVAEAVRVGAVLGENILIDGIEVSGMGVAQARKLLLAQHREELGDLQYELRAGEKTAVRNAAELGAGFDVDTALLEALALHTHYPSNNIPRSVESGFFIDGYALRKEAEKIAAVLSAAPTDASALYDREQGGFIYTADVKGQSVSAEELEALVSEALETGVSGSLEAPYAVMDAAYTLADAKADTTLIASFFTSFAGKTYSKAGRVFNIEKAASLINGTTLLPGAEFDMNAILGPRNGENGWKEATGIRDAVYVQEYGGGVCQVSSTLYNAVLMADLAVTERVHHSWPLGYIDIGRDATISTGGPNFRFVNSGEAPVTVCASVDREKQTVTVSLYGRALPEGTSIKIKSEKLETLPEPEVEYITDDTLSPGELQVVREPRRGSISVTYKEYYDAEGKLIKREQVTKDKYRSISGITHVGPVLSVPEEAGA